jgi:hypothetical protein
MTRLPLPEDRYGNSAASDLLGEDGGAHCLHYQPWLTVKGGALQAIAQEVFDAIPPPAVGPRRTNRKDATERRRSCLYALIANLTVLALSPLNWEALVAPMAKVSRTRYDRADFSIEVQTLCIQALQFLEVLAIIPGVFRRTRTRLVVSEGFSAKLRARRVTLDDVGKAPGGETILLRASKGRHGQSPALVDYPDGSRSQALRREMEELNAALNAADIRLDGLPVPPIHMVRIFQQDDLDAPPTWTRHGRMYRGSPWLDLQKDQRYRLTMGGEPLADLDYSACFLHLAYVKMNAPFPAGDPYSLDGLEHQRGMVKQLTTSLFFRKVRPSRLPVGFRAGLPEDWNMLRFMDAITEKHPAISRLFGTEVGWEFFNTESCIMMAVVRHLLQRGIVALPCHDGALVQQTHKLLTTETMRRVSKAVLGRELPVAEKPILRPLAT